MQEQEISDRIHAAFDVEPLAGGFDRLRLALDASTVDRRSTLRAPFVRRWVPLVAALVAVAIAASAVAYALEMRQSAVSNPHRPAAALLPVMAYWAYSANDVALRLSPPSGVGQSGRGYVLITHDGGKSWVQTPLDQDRINLRWIDSRHLVATMDNVGPPFEVASTSDGGATWRVTRMPLNTSSSATSTCCRPFQIGTMFFLNDKEGWALCTRIAMCESNGNQTILYHTVDSGAHWQPISDVIGAGRVLPTGVSFADADHGFMSTVSTDATGSLLVTSDGGRTWREIDLRAPADQGSHQDRSGSDCGSGACVLTPTLFGSRGVVVLVTPTGGTYSFTTTDGGVTWGSPRELAFTPAPIFTDDWLAAIDPLEWWAIDDVGTLHETNDAGATWRAITTRVPSGYKIGLVTPVGYGVLWGMTSAPDSYPIRSTDGGQTWSLVKLPKT